MSRNIFMTVMEAEGDLVQPFDDGGGESDAGQPEDVMGPSPQPDVGNDGGMDDGPPPLNDTGGDTVSDFSPDENGGGFEGDMGNEESGNSDDQKEESLTEKSNNILNKRLYQTMIDRNNEVEQTIEGLQKIIPLLPYEIVKVNDVSLNKLKMALNKGKSYVIDKFIDAQYGENLLYYNKLNSLYTLLMDNIDKNLKKIK